MKTIIKIILISALILTGPIYLIVGPTLTKAPKSVQTVQKELKKIPDVIELQPKENMEPSVNYKAKSMPLAPAPKPSVFDSVIKNLKEIVTLLSSMIGLVLGARELKNNKKRKRATAKR